jgi:hypothetical protein
VAVQAGPADPRGVKAAIKGESRFLWRVIKCANNKIFAGVSTGPPRQFFIFRRETLNNCRPGNIRERSRANKNSADPNDQS